MKADEIDELLHTLEIIATPATISAAALIREQRADRARLVALLTRLEWSANWGQLSSGRCPKCRRLRPDGHVEDCELRAALDAARAAEGAEG